MRNRAKCKLCNETIEVLVHNEYVHCKCGEITIGPDLYCKATDFKNFLRISDENGEIPVSYQDKQAQENGEIDKEKELHIAPPSKDELLSMLTDMIKSYENLPQHALNSPISHADHYSLLLLLESLFRAL